MLDMKFIRENPELVKNACRVKGFADYTDEILKMDEQVRALKTSTQSQTAEKNKITQQIPTAEDKAPLIAKSREISEQIANDLKQLEELEIKLNDLMHRVPQIPNENSPIGPDDNSNVEIFKSGNVPNFDFEPRAHWDILDMNGWWMPESISKICGTRTYALVGDAAELELAVQNYVIDKIRGKGFTLINCPAITKPASVFNAGHFLGSDLSVMDNDVFMLTDTDRCLAGTSEIILNSLFAGDILTENELPKKFMGLSQCFRKEAGAAGRDTRGLTRVHQFNKVEQFIFCEPNKSNEMFDELAQNLCEVMEDLELPYRVLDISTGDMGFNKIKQKDIEAWIPSDNKYLELGSCSAIGEFQARRTNTRYRENKTGDVKFVATLNNTAIALPRALGPILENHQNADGSINIPKKLQPFMGGKTKIGGTK